MTAMPWAVSIAAYGSVTMVTSESTAAWLCGMASLRSWIICAGLTCEGLV